MGPVAPVMNSRTRRHRGSYPYGGALPATRSARLHGASNADNPGPTFRSKRAELCSGKAIAN